MAKRGRLTAEQYQALRRPVNRVRVATRRGGGRELSYLESWDVRAHLIRVLGFCNFDVETVESDLVFERPISIKRGRDDEEVEGIEVAYKAVVRLVVRDQQGRELCRYAEAAIGSASGSVGFGDLHDNAIKSAESDAMKRCAVNLGNQFGLSLYDNGSQVDVVRKPLIYPEGAERETPQEDTHAVVSDEQAKVLSDSLGATSVPENGSQAPQEPSPDEVPQFGNQADTPEEVAAAISGMGKALRRD